MVVLRPNLMRILQNCKLQIILSLRIWLRLRELRILAKKFLIQWQLLLYLWALSRRRVSITSTALLSNLMVTFVLERILQQIGILCSTDIKRISQSWMIRGVFFIAVVCLSQEEILWSEDTTELRRRSVSSWALSKTQAFNHLVGLWLQVITPSWYFREGMMRTRLKRIKIE